MSRVVFDIETVGVDFEGLDTISQEYFLKFADTPEKVAEAKASLSFYPLTAQIVAIAMLDADKEKGSVFFQDGGSTITSFEENGTRYIPGDETQILKDFWKVASGYDQLISFNGRVFDGPFIMLRSACHRIRTVKNLVPYRYSAGVHVDLADQMSFYDALRRKFSLHMWCKAFGIPSPKEGGISGLMVKDLFSAARYKDIARYCMEDVRATKELYQYWEKYLRF